MQELFRRLRPLGFSRNYVRRVALPEWWSDDLGASESGLAEAHLYLSKHLGLDLESLQKDGEVRPADLPVRYKKMGTADPSQLATARGIAIAGVRLALAATPAGATLAMEAVPSAQEIRRTILEGDNLVVSLEPLLDYCWSRGLPVLHVADFPNGAKKMHGLATLLKGRAAIVLSHNSNYTSWHLFLLAHELGHLHHGHVTEGGTLVDHEIDTPSDDEEERVANRFARELLTGKQEKRVQAGGHWPNARELAEAARIWGTENGVDPGHFVLNYAHSRSGNFWPVAHAALRIIEPHADAPGLISRRMVERLDWSRLPEESSRFLVEVTHADRPVDAASG